MTKRTRRRASARKNSKKYKIKLAKEKKNKQTRKETEIRNQKSKNKHWKITAFDVPLVWTIFDSSFFLMTFGCFRFAFRIGLFGNSNRMVVERRRCDTHVLEVLILFVHLFSSFFFFRLGCRSLHFLTDKSLRIFSLIFFFLFSVVWYWHFSHSTDIFCLPVCCYTRKLWFVRLLFCYLALCSSFSFLYSLCFSSLCCVWIKYVVSAEREQYSGQKQQNK